jgi:hypothetical protein
VGGTACILMSRSNPYSLTAFLSVGFGGYLTTLQQFYVVTCRGDYRRVLDWMIGCIDPYTFTTRGLQAIHRYR